MVSLPDLQDRAAHEQATAMMMLLEAHRNSCRGESIAPAVYELVAVALDRTLELLAEHAPKLRPVFDLRANALRRATAEQLALEETQAPTRDTTRLKLIQSLDRFALDLDRVLDRSAI